MSASELKTKLGRLIGELGRDGVPFYVTQYGKPKAVLVSYEEYESLMERMEDLEDLLSMEDALSSPKNEGVSFEELKVERAANLPD